VPGPHTSFSRSYLNDLSGCGGTVRKFHSEPALLSCAVQACRSQSEERRSPRCGPLPVIRSDGSSIAKRPENRRPSCLGLGKESRACEWVVRAESPASALRTGSGPEPAPRQLRGASVRWCRLGRAFRSVSARPFESSACRRREPRRWRAWLRVRRARPRR
jgi:hypothetical protein